MAQPLAIASVTLFLCACFAEIGTTSPTFDVPATQGIGVIVIFVVRTLSLTVRMINSEIDVWRFDFKSRSVLDAQSNQMVELRTRQCGAVISRR
jgi:hypothetical protein